MTADFRALSAYLRRWDARRRRGELLLWLPRGLFTGLLAALGLALLSRARPLLAGGELARVAVILALVALTLTAAVVLLRRRPVVEQARFADRQFGLRQRMIAAVEIHSGRLPANETMAAGQLANALAVAASVDPARDMPLAVRPANWLPAALTLAALVALLWLPNPQEAVLLESREVAALAEEQAEALAALSEQIATDESLTAEQREALQQPLDEAMAALAEPGISREELTAALSQAETEMRALSQEFDTATVAEALTEAAASLEGSAAAAGLAAALQAGQLGQASAAAGALAEGLDALSPEELAELADRLDVMAGALGAADPALQAALERAAGALAEGDTVAGQEALGEVAAALGDGAGSQAAAGQAESAANQLGAARGEVAQGSGQGESTTSGGQGDGASAGQDGSQSGSGTTGGTGQEGGAGGVSQGGGHVENVFVPGPVDLEGEGEALELDAECLADPASCGPVLNAPSTNPGQSGGSVVPYDQVFGQYRDAAFEALSAEDIPLRLQDLVRDYFTALEP
jgi:hypothetical protein